MADRACYITWQGKNRRKECGQRPCWSTGPAKLHAISKLVESHFRAVGDPPCVLQLDQHSLVNTPPPDH